MPNKQLLKEELSKNLKKAVNKAAENMIEELDLTTDEAYYVAGLYGQLKDRNLFKAKYIQNIELEADEGEKVPNLNDLTQMADYPELIYDIVKYVLLEEDKFVSKYDILFDSETKEVSLKKKKKKKKKKKSSSGYTTKWDEYKVAEDLNWNTYLIPKYDSDWATFYQRAFPDDIRLKHPKASSLYTTRWCILSSSYGPRAFNGEKNNDSRNKWYITFSKHNPADLAIDFIKKSDLPEGRKEVFIDMINNPQDADRSITNYLDQPLSSSSHASSLRDELVNTKFGELCLTNHKKNFDYPRGNFGIHNFSNSPNYAYAGPGDSVLNPPKEYEYLNFKSVEGPFTIDNGILTSYNDNESFVKIPEGVTKIGPGAFKRKSVVAVSLPMSLTTIMKDAFYECGQLDRILATNNLSYIQRGAFDSESASDLLIGVFEADMGEVIVKKPVSLRHAPDFVYDNLEQYAEESPEKEEGEQAPAEESKKYILSEKVRLKNKPLYDYESEHFIIEHGVLYFNEENKEKKFGDFEIPEGVRFFGSRVYGSFDDFVLPSTFISWPTDSSRLLASRIDKIKTFDMSKVTKVRVIQDKKFFYYTGNTFILPESIEKLGENSFAFSKIKSIYIPSKIGYIHSKAFMYARTLSTIITDDVERLKLVLEPINTEVTVDDLPKDKVNELSKEEIEAELAALKKEKEKEAEENRVWLPKDIEIIKK